MFKSNKNFSNLNFILPLFGIIIGMVIGFFVFRTKDDSQKTSNIFDFTPLYTNMPVNGMDNVKGQNVVISLSKPQFEKLDISTLKDVYEGNDAVTFAFDDGSALVYVKEDNTMHFASYDKVRMEVTVN